MAKLSSLALSDVLAAFTIAGLPSARDVEGLSEVLLLVRNRIRASPQVDDLGAQRLAIQKCVAPLVQWLEGEPDVIDLDVQRKTDLLWNLYSATVSRTVLADQFNLVVTNEETWNDVMTELFPRWWQTPFSRIPMLVLGTLLCLVDGNWCVGAGARSAGCFRALAVLYPGL